MHAKIDSKFGKKKSMLLKGYTRCQAEQEFHLKQKESNSYKKYFYKYAYPINAYKFNEDQKKEIDEYTT
jgi:hypothetical protein